MTLETVKALSDVELSQVEMWVQNEKKLRTERRKEDAIAKIKALAESVGIKIAIGGAKGRPVRTKTDSKNAKPESLK